jgi:hypothetical protein
VTLRRAVAGLGCIVALVTVAAACTSSEATAPTPTTAAGGSTAVTAASTAPSESTTTALPSTTTTTTTAAATTNATTTVPQTTVRVDSPRPRPLAVEGVSRGVSDSVVRLHLGLLGSPPSPGELRADVERYRETGSFVGLTDEVLSSPEYLARRAGAPSDDAFVRRLYSDVLGRPPDPAGAASWLANLGQGMSRAAVAAEFVQSPEAVIHTGTATPEPPPPPRGGSREPVVRAPTGGALAVGDSVMLGASASVQQAIPGIAVDAAVSRQFTTGTDILRSVRDGGQLPGTVVVHLGTNGPIDGDSCDALMDVLAGRRVVLVTLHVPRSWEAGNNAVLRECAFRHGAGIADWSSIAGGAGFLAGDGYHLDTEGAQAYAGLIASVI